MPFDWDEAKNEANFRKHGIYFEAAEEVFSDEVLTVADTRHDYGEPRLYQLGGAAQARACDRPYTSRGRDPHHLDEKGQ